MLEGDYSASEFDGELPSAPPHVDLEQEQAVEAINDLVGADYSAKYAPLTSSNTTQKSTRH
jgi:hypothetical protein